MSGGKSDPRISLTNPTGESISLSSNFPVPEHDYIGITNNVSNNPTSIVYRDGGAGGSVVGTITVTYDVDNETILSISFTP